MTNLDSILKSRDITLPTKFGLVKAMVFPVVIYGCESWTVKKTECWKIDASELLCWRRLLRVPGTARRSNQSIQKEISREYSLERLMLKLQYFEHLMQRLIGKDSDAEKAWTWEEKRTTEDEMVGWHHWLDGHEFEQIQVVLMGRKAWYTAVHEVTKSWTWLSDSTQLSWYVCVCRQAYMSAIL